jgi:glycosyltransferase involved in cell wall biosynthesis
MSPNHVLVIPSWYPQFAGDPGGSFFREKAIALAQRLPKVGVLFPNQRSLREFWNSSAKPSGTEILVDNNVHVAIRYGFNWTPRFKSGIAWQWLANGTALFNEYVTKHGRPDIIHAHCALYAGHLARKISAETGIPYVVTEHSSGYFCGDFNRRQLGLAADVFIESSANLAVSSSLARLLQETHGFGQRWQVVPNIVESNFYTAPLQSTCTLGRLRLLNVALLRPIKRQRLLLEAIDLCRQTGKGIVELTIVGDGPERAMLEREVAVRGLQKQVQMLGFVPRAELPAIMAAHDAFVLSSDYETFGVVVAEALATGLPCIATDCGGPADILGPGDGTLVPCGNAKVMAEAMLSLLDQPDELQARVARRTRSAVRFSEGAVSQALDEVYCSVLSQKSSKP